MNTQEYLWWIETIRQDEFRKKLPSNIIGWVALTMSLIALFIFILYFSVRSPDDKEVQYIAFFVCLISFFIGVTSMVLGEISSKRSRKYIEEVKKIWNIKANENKIVHEGLKWFYAE